MRRNLAANSHYLHLRHFGFSLSCTSAAALFLAAILPQSSSAQSETFDFSGGAGGGGQTVYSGGELGLSRTRTSSGFTLADANTLSSAEATVGAELDSAPTVTGWLGAATGLGFSGAEMLVATDAGASPGASSALLAANPGAGIVNVGGSLATQSITWQFGGGQTISAMVDRVLFSTNGGPGTRTGPVAGTGVVNNGGQSLDGPGGDQLQDEANRPAALQGVGSYWNDTSFENANLNGVLITFDTPLQAFGAWFGDTESRDDGEGLEATVRLFSGGSQVGTDVNPSASTDSGTRAGFDIDDFIIQSAAGGNFTNDGAINSAWGTVSQEQGLTGLPDFEDDGSNGGTATDGVGDAVDTLAMTQFNGIDGTGVLNSGVETSGSLGRDESSSASGGGMGAGSGTTRWIGFVSDTLIDQMLVVVGDDDGSVDTLGYGVSGTGTGRDDNGLSEFLSFIGPTIFAAPAADPPGTGPIVPEPSGLVLALLGIAVFLCRQRRVVGRAGPSNR